MNPFPFDPTHHPVHEHVSPDQGPEARYVAWWYDRYTKPFVSALAVAIVLASVEVVCAFAFAPAPPTTTRRDAASTPTTCWPASATAR